MTSVVSETNYLRAREWYQRYSPKQVVAEWARAYCKPVRLSVSAAGTELRVNVPGGRGRASCSISPAFVVRGFRRDVDSRQFPLNSGQECPTSDDFRRAAIHIDERAL
jgi:hypothetical protein